MKPGAGLPFGATLRRALALPAFAPLRGAAAGFQGEEAWPAVEVYAERLGPGLLPLALTGSPLAFSPAEAPPPRRGGRAPRHVGTLYDGRIVLEGTVPTRRESWHDFLNFLVWATFPRAKHGLHERQFRAQRARLPATFTTQPAARTREQDALALLDEGGLLLVTAQGAAVRTALALASPGALHDLLQGGAAAALLFGHAVYEHLAVGPGTVVRAAPTVLDVDTLPSTLGARCRAADEGLAALLADVTRFTEPSTVRAVDVTDDLFV